MKSVIYETLVNRMGTGYCMIWGCSREDMKALYPQGVSGSVFSQVYAEVGGDKIMNAVPFLRTVSHGREGERHFMFAPNPIMIAVGEALFGKDFRVYVAEKWRLWDPDPDGEPVETSISTSSEFEEE